MTHEDMALYFFFYIPKKYLKNMIKCILGPHFLINFETLICKHRFTSLLSFELLLIMLLVKFTLFNIAIKLLTACGSILCLSLFLQNCSFYCFIAQF